MAKVESPLSDSFQSHPASPSEAFCPSLLPTTPERFMEAGPSEYHLGLQVAQMFQVSLFSLLACTFQLMFTYAGTPPTPRGAQNL
jgi:hypothetical protein